jgi:hypothetical protein
MKNKSQIEFWNGETGRNWVAYDALMEAMLQVQVINFNMLILLIMQ